MTESLSLQSPNVRALCWAMIVGLTTYGFYSLIKNCLSTDCTVRNLSGRVIVPWGTASGLTYALLASNLQKKPTGQQSNSEQNKSSKPGSDAPGTSESRAKGPGSQSTTTSTSRSSPGPGTRSEATLGAGAADESGEHRPTPDGPLLTTMLTEEELKRIDDSCGWKQFELNQESIINQDGITDYGESHIPQHLAELDQKFAQPFRLKMIEGVPWIGCERGFGTNLETLISLGLKRGCYPANKLDLSRLQESTEDNWHYIIAEPPQDHKSGSRDLYYQMVVEQGSRLLVTCTNAVCLDQPHCKETQHFLELEEELTVNTAKGLARIKVIAQTVENLDEELEEFATPTGAHQIWCRVLQVRIEGGETYRILQILPNFIPGGNPWPLSQWYVDFVSAQAQKHKITVGVDHPVIVNCNTGRDRSAQFIILHHLTTRLRQAAADFVSNHPQATEVEIQTAVTISNMPEILLAAARVIQPQVSKGAALESINQSLLPSFNAALLADKEIQDSNCKVFDPKLIADVNDERYASPAMQERMRKAANDAYSNLARQFIEEEAAAAAKEETVEG
jgi:hypothetical protein